jgi:hypothetical protein
MIDGAVSQALDRVRAIDNASAVLDRIEEVLRETASLARSPSTAERAKEMMRNVASHRESLCAFCGKRSATAASCGVLRGKKEIGREHVFNGVRVTYSVTAMLVARCEACAELHHYFRGVRNTVAGVALVVVALGWALFDLPGTVVFGWAVGAAVVGVAAFSTITSRITPKGEHQYRSYERSEGYQRLRQQGYGIESYDYTRTAGAQLLAQRGIS